jgi:anti-repressor protein
MNELQIFKNNQFGNVRIVMKGQDPWFVAKDICNCLEINNSRQALIRLDDDEKSSVILNDGTPGNPEKSIVNEYGLYSLVLSSRKQEAKEFKRWITHDVIPQIRKTGQYVADIPKTLPDALRAYANEVEEHNKAKALIEEQKPKVLFADSVAASHTSILVGDLAKLLHQNGVKDMGQKRLFNWLRENSYLIKRKGSDYNSPTQKAMEMGLFQIKETVVSHADGHTSVNKTTKVTGKGQQYFINKFLGE